MPRALSCDPGRVLAATAMASFGVLGWLLAQWATFGIAEHSHLTSHGVVEHHHAYAGPLAAVAALAAATSLLAIVAVRLRRTSAPQQPRRGRLVIPAMLAATLFVVVEAAEFYLAGMLHEPPVAGILLLGATLQLVALPTAWSLGGRAADLAERAADIPGGARPTPRPSATHLVLGEIRCWPREARSWSRVGRGPPVDLRFLSGPTTPASATPPR